MCARELLGRPQAKRTSPNTLRLMVRARTVPLTIQESTRWNTRSQHATEADLLAVGLNERERMWTYVLRFGFWSALASGRDNNCNVCSDAAEAGPFVSEASLWRNGGRLSVDVKSRVGRAENAHDVHGNFLKNRKYGLRSCDFLPMFRHCGYLWLLHRKILQWILKHEISASR